MEPTLKLLYYYRCNDCLEIVTSDEYYRHHELKCDCGGWYEPLGQVQQDRLIKPELRCPCDERCTTARGPKCSCHCGGCNHGSHLLVKVIRDCGPIPIIRPPDPMAKERAREYRDLSHLIVETASAGKYNPDKWLPPDTFYTRNHALNMRNHAAKLKTHENRMKYLRDAMKLLNPNWTPAKPQAPTGLNNFPLFGGSAI
jgi:hypothetical protein